MAKMRECKIYVIETKSALPHAKVEWVNLFPEQRFSYDDVVAFEDELTYEDCFGIRYRARMTGPWGKEVLHLEPHCAADPDPIRHVRTTLNHGECLPPTGWPLILHMIGAQA